MSEIDTDNSNIGFKIILKYQNKEYECDAYGWYDGDWTSPYEFDGVRNCEHDYASLLPRDVVGDKDFGCEQIEIEVMDYWFYNKDTKEKLK